MRHKLRQFLYKIRRANRWWKFWMGQNPWMEYDQYCAMMRKGLIEMAEEFERKDILMNSKANAQEMREIAEKIAIFTEERNHSAYLNQHFRDNPNEDFQELGWFDDSYSTEESLKAQQEDHDALKSALFTLANRMPFYWQ